MKKRFTTPKYKAHVERRKKSSLKKRRQHKAWLINKRRAEQGKPKAKYRWEQKTKKRKTVNAPECFSLIKNPNEVLSFVATLKEHCKKGHEVHISLANVKEISHDAISMILSVIGDYNAKNLFVSGDKPKNQITKKILERSGFFNHVQGFIGDENKDTINSILTKGKKVVKPDETAPVVTGAMQTVWGKKRRNQKLQGMLIELMANSVNHAFTSKNEVRWWLSVNHDLDKNCVTFAFVDNGFGILKTIKSKGIFKKIAHIFANNADLLEDLFSGKKIATRTKLVNRGRGLPSIFERNSGNYISKLMIITNDVMIDFSNKKKDSLKKPFEGTFYYWELNKECESWKK